MDNSKASKIVHASCVSYAGSAVLICGASGSGKSALALQMMGLGASLVSDDGTRLEKVDGSLVAAAPAELAGLIEARGIGILRASVAEPCRVSLVIDLDQVEHKRFPDKHNVTICGVDLPCLHKVEGSYFPAAILQYLRAGRRDPS